MKVLIADKSFAIRIRLIKLLSTFKDISIMDIKDSVEGIKKSFAAISHDVIIIDYQSFGQPIHDIIRILKSKNENIRIIILSSFTHPDLFNKCKEVGADYFLDKNSEFKKIFEILSDEKSMVLNTPN